MFIKLVRLGRDAELRQTQSGKSVCSLACVYDIGYGQNKKGQWIEAVLWDKRAESLAPYLTKGSQFVLTGDDVCIEEYEHNGQMKSKLKCRVVDVALCGGQQQQQPQQAPQQQYQQAPPMQQQPPMQQPQQAPMQSPQQPIDDLDSDIPF